MARGWVGRVGTWVKHALVRKPQTWPALVVGLVGGTILALVVWALLNRVEMLRSPGPPVLTLVRIWGVNVYAFVRRRRRERAGTREAAQESHRPGAG